MALLGFTLGLLTALVGMVGLVAPGLLAAATALLHGPLGLAFAGVYRLLFGAALFVAAPASRAPLAFRALGIAVLAVGALTPLIGVARFGAQLDWWVALDPLTRRAWSACAAAFGAFVAYGIIPRDAR